MIDVKKLLPRFVHRWYMVCQTYGYDISRMLRFGFGYSHTSRNVNANLMMVLHTLEKGLTMPNIRLGFGQDKIERIAILLKQLYDTETNAYEVKYAQELVREYLKFHEKRGFQLSEKTMHIINAKITPPFSWRNDSPTAFYGIAILRQGDEHQVVYVRQTHREELFESAYRTFCLLGCSPTG